MTNLSRLNVRSALAGWPRRLAAGLCFTLAAVSLLAHQSHSSSAVRLLVTCRSLAAGVLMDNERRIKALLIETKSGRAAILGKVFIDCSGDGDLAVFAGAAYEKGDASGNTLYPTMMFRLNGVDAAEAGDAWRTIPQLMDKAEKRGVKFPRKGAIVRPQKHSGEWRVNVTQVKNAQGRAVDGTDAAELSAGEIEGRPDGGDLRVEAGDDRRPCRAQQVGRRGDGGVDVGGRAFDPGWHCSPRSIFLSIRGRGPRNRESLSGGRRP